MNDDLTTGTLGLNLIKVSEGLRLEAYKDPPGYSIGYGHSGRNAPPPVMFGMKITQQQADEFLIADLKLYEGYIKKYVMVPLNQNQFDALVSFTYNAGPGKLKLLIVDSLLNNKCYDKIGSQLMLYNKAGGKVLPGLTRRRSAEAELFSRPVGQTKLLDTVRSVKVAFQSWMNRKYA